MTKYKKGFSVKSNVHTIEKRIFLFFWETHSRYYQEYKRDRKFNRLTKAIAN
jgi:hypothetical protein